MRRALLVPPPAPCRKYIFISRDDQRFPVSHALTSSRSSCAAVLIAAAAIIGWAADVASSSVGAARISADASFNGGCLHRSLRGLHRPCSVMTIAFRPLAYRGRPGVSLGSLTGIAARLIFDRVSRPDASEKQRRRGPLSSNRSSPNTPFILLLLGLSLIFLRSSSREKWFSEVLAAAAVVSTFALGLGRFYHAEAPFLMSGSQGAALGSELLFVLLSVAMIVRNPRSRLLQLFGSDSLGGTAARRLIPPASSCRR